MINNMAKLSILSFALLLIYQTGSAQTDSCTAKVPANLIAAVAQAFPNHRLPLVSDSVAYDVNYDIQHGGDGCIRIASGDYDGNGQLDYAFVLTPKIAGKGETAIVVAWAKGKRYDFKIIREVNGWINLYVYTGKPGNYRRTQVLDGQALEPGEVTEFNSELPGIIFGTTEASGVAYFFKHKKWLHVWISD